MGRRQRTLADWKIGYDEVSLLPDGSVDWEGVERALKPETKVAAIQRSRGYSTRRSFSVDEIAEMVRRLKQLRPDLVIFVDNCYGEFAETKEPTDVGADLIAGSLIKNPGGRHRCYRRLHRRQKRMGGTGQSPSDCAGIGE